MTKYKYTCYWNGGQKSEEVVEFNGNPTEEDVIQDCKNWSCLESGLEYSFEKIEE